MYIHLYIDHSATSKVMDRKQEILITRSLQLVVEAQDAQDAQDLTFGTRNLKLGTKFAHFGSFWHLGFKFSLQDFTR